MDKKEKRYGGNGKIMQGVNKKEQRACLAKVYGEPTLDVTYFYGNDVITASNPNDNNFDDSGDWD